MKNKIYVTQPSMPPLKEYLPFLKTIWKKKVLTNQGDFHKELEKKLCKHLGVKYISLVSNGTMALVLSLKSLNIKNGEVITTPYTFIATSNALLWNNIKPVFVDIEKESLTINTKKVEEKINKNTKAIMAVHVYGHPCDVEKLEKISKKYKVPIIYDAAHAFGVKINNKTLFNFGDISILSFHATKIFNTFEGGAVICKNKKIKNKIDQLKNFGFTSDTNINLIGLNAKLNELQAAMGLLQLKYINQYIKKRKNITNRYKKKLKNIPGINFLKDKNNVEYNYSYFPIFINKKKYGKTRNNLQKELRNNNIFTRRYFYPLVSDFTPYKKFKPKNKHELQNAEQKSKEVICLPIYPHLTNKEIDKIIKIIKNFYEKK